MKRISLIIPSYNESEDIERKINVLKDYIKENLHDEEYFIVPVNDGSKDNTGEVIKSIEGIYPVSYEPNHGKGYAVKEGIKYSFNELNVDYAIFMDADLSTDLKAIKECVTLLEEGTPFVAGSRYSKDSVIKVKQPLKRRFISKCSRIIISSMFHFKIKETQCGFKGVNKELGLLLVDKAKMERFSFDVEYFYIAKLNNYKYVTFPVVWSDDKGSTVTAFRTSVKFFKDLFKIKKNKKSYIK